MPQSKQKHKSGKKKSQRNAVDKASSPINFSVKVKESYVSFTFGLRNGRAELVLVNTTKYDLHRLYECYQISPETLKQAVIKLPVMQQMKQHGDISKVLEIVLRDLPKFFEGEAKVIDGDEYLKNGGEA